MATCLFKGKRPGSAIQQLLLNQTLPPETSLGKVDKKQTSTAKGKPNAQIEPDHEIEQNPGTYQSFIGLLPFFDLVYNKSFPF